MKRISLLNVLVEDQDRALAFYRDQLGFTVAEDLPFGEQRWITLRAADDTTVALSLNLAKGDDKKLVGRQGGSQPLFGIATDDCAGDYARMKKLGVRFHGEPQVQPYGTGVLLEDLYGNKIYLNEERR